MAMATHQQRAASPRLLSGPLPTGRQVCRQFKLILRNSSLSIFVIMRIDIISVLPELLKSPFEHSIMKRAQAKGLLEVHTHNLRKWAINNQGQVDDYQYGGGAGMVMMCEPLTSAIEELSAVEKYDEIIYLTPDGEKLDQR